MDGAAAQRPVRPAAQAAAVTVVSRRRHDTARFDEPPPTRPGATQARGRPRLDGTKRLDLAKRAGPSRGWHEGAFAWYGQQQPQRDQSLRASWRPAAGPSRVVLVNRAEPPTPDKDWSVYVSTHPDASVDAIRPAVAERGSWAQAFKDLKELAGVGQQHVRNVWAKTDAP